MRQSAGTWIAAPRIVDVAFLSAAAILDDGDPILLATTSERSRHVYQATRCQTWHLPGTASRPRRALAARRASV
jgi:hypothetical protein